MSSSASAGRSSRSTRRSANAAAGTTSKDSTPPVSRGRAAAAKSAKESTNVAAKSAKESTNAAAADSTLSVQELKDELEELTETKVRLENKVTQLEERAQYLEANARLNASMSSKEIVDLKEKSRKLEIQLSTAVDERDTLEQEKEQLAKQIEDTQDKKDEAKQLSANLKDAWLRLSTITDSQKEYVQKLFESEEANVKLKAELEKVVSLSDTFKNSHADEKKRWEAEKQEYMAEIESLKEKLTQSSKDGGKQIIDWEEDKVRLRNNLKHERSVWDKEKKGFLDQIASLKVKVTALSVQKTAPPEWILEKHQLVEKCTNLQLRVTTLEGERGSGLDKSNLKKLEAEKQKLEKKVETLKTKLVEVLHSAATLQSKKGQRARPTARRKSRAMDSDSSSGSEDEGSAMDVQEEEEGARKTPPVKAKPPPRTTRAKRTASVKRVNYRLSSDESEESEEDDSDDDEDDDSDEGDEGGEPEQPTGEPSDSKGEDMEVDEEPSTAKDKGSSSASKRARSKDTPDTGEDSTASHSTARSKKSASGKTRKPAEDDASDSDSEFEPPAKPILKVKGRSKGNDKKAASPAVEPVPKKSKVPLQSKEQLGGTAAASAESPAATSTAESTPATDGSTATNPKVKKKRKLLTGKGLEELGDILNGPGSSLSSSPSTGLLFGKGNIRSRTSSNNPSSNSQPGSARIGESSLLNGNGAATVKLDALNAIKMAFTLPKPRNPSPG